MNSKDEISLGNGSPLSLDPTVRIENNVNKISIMDQYEIHVFNTETQEKLKNAEKDEQAKISIIKNTTFYTCDDIEKQELSLIRYTVFESGSLLTKDIEESKNIDMKNATYNYIYIGIGLLIGLIGTIYAKHKKKEREKRIADINNSYDE